MIMSHESPEMDHVVDEQRKRPRDAQEALFVACKSGSLADVGDAVQDGANVNAFNGDGFTPLMLACNRRDWEVAEQIVSALLGHGPILWVADHAHRTCLHLAVMHSSVAVVSLLLKAKANADIYALSCCCLRGMDDDVEIATLLLDAGLDPDTAKVFVSLACMNGTAKLVELLLTRGGNWTRDVTTIPSAVAACDNVQHGEEIIQVLVKHGIEVDAADENGTTTLEYAFHRGGSMMRAVAPHIPKNGQLAGMFPRSDCPDPIGSMTEATAFGFVPSASDFGECVRDGEPAAYCWAMLRNGVPYHYNGQTPDDIFMCMAECVDSQLWKLVVAELGTTRHPLTHDTLLHMAACTDNLEAVRACRDWHINPLIRNNQGALAIEFATDAGVRAELASMVARFPNAPVTYSFGRWLGQWFGPYFKQRARTWLLVSMRWRLSKTHDVQKEMQQRIMQFVAAAEETSVRRLE